MERIRHETIDEYFFESPVWDEEGNIVPAPPEALQKYTELKEQWMTEHPTLPKEIPSVSLHPIYTSEKVGYVVSTQIIYKPSYVFKSET